MDSKLYKHLSTMSARMDRDWTSLPQDVIPIIGEKASTTNIQYVHIRSVCKTWLRALGPNPRHLPRQAPWLIVQPDRTNDPRLSFYDLRQSRVHRFNSLHMSTKHIFGTYYGWIVLVYEERVSLHNPLTRASMQLPSLDAPPSVVGVIKPKIEVCGRFIERRYIRKVVFSCHPSDDGFVAVALLVVTADWEIAIWRKGDTHWTGLKMKQKGPMVLDITCGNNSVYVVSGRKEVFAYDLASLAMTNFPSKITYNGLHDRLNLVEGDAKSDGPLIVVSTDYLRQSKRIYVYEWINNMKRWRRTKNIGRSVLFLSHRDCFRLQLKELGGNEIYYEVLRILPEEDPESMHVCYSVGINRMNLQTGVIVPHSPSPSEVIPAVSGWPDTWFTPSLR